MSGKSVHPTLQDIADRTGYGRSTVSLALRGHPSLPEKTREKIRRVAEEIGYRPNPLVAALMAQLRGRKRRYQETIAIITRRDHPTSDDQPPFNFYDILYRAIVEHSLKLGFRIDRFSMENENCSGARLSKILITRGIHGVIFFPGSTPKVDYPILNWDHFATVLVGYDPDWPILHQVVSDYAHDIDLALQIATQNGSRRIGLAIHEERDLNINHSWSSRFLNYQRHLPTKNRIPFIPGRDLSFKRETFLAWVQKQRPDTLLVAGDEEVHWLKEAGHRIPQDIRVINLIQRGEKELAGIDPRTEEVGRGAVELLRSLLQDNQLGLPEFPRLIAIKGRWSAGASFPKIGDEPYSVSRTRQLPTKDDTGRAPETR